MQLVLSVSGGFGGGLRDVRLMQARHRMLPLESIPVAPAHVNLMLLDSTYFGR